MKWLTEMIYWLGRTIHGAIMSLVQNERWAAIVSEVIFILVFVGILLFMLKITQKFMNRLKAKLELWRGTRILPIKIQSFEVVSAEQLTNILQWLVDKGKILVYLILLYIFIPIFFAYFPRTRCYILEYLDYLVAPFITIFHGIISFIPNLVFIAITIYIVRYLVKLMRLIFSEVQKGRVTFPGFHSDWAQPTFKLLRFLAIVVTVVLISPYLPGFGSPAFQGLSIFFGLLLSLGSTAAIANVVAGAALTYMRPFKVGDRVKIADTMGDIIEKTLLITRVRTIKNVEVTIPNSMVLGSHMINFSALAQEGRLIIYTSVTIGYDVPWRQVHDLLIEAAKATPGIIPEPPPFVLQTALNDYSVTYELNAYSADAQQILGIQSKLHQNIQDKFNEAGVEIMSPSYSAIRDGNQATIPEDYLPKNYEPKSFRLLPMENILRLKENPSG